MRFLFTVLAGSVWVVHLVWTLLMAAGIGLIFIYPAYAPFHLVLVSGTLIFNLILGDCPLTLVERTFSSVAGHETDERTFTERLFHSMGWRLSRRGVVTVLLVVKLVSYTATILVMTV